MPTVKSIDITEERPKPDVVDKLHDHCAIEIAGQNYVVTVKDLEKIVELGRGRYGKVLKYRHKEHNFLIAVKQIATDLAEPGTVLRELDVGIKAASCKYLIKSYGALLYEGEIWVLLPLMDLSLDKLLNRVKEKNNKFPFDVLQLITYGTIQGLEALHDFKIIHRDVKPSNILVNKQGDLKICDYGISGHLINSIANTNVGSEMYLAPERIDTQESTPGFGIKSDVWSLGLSILELATLNYPYPTEHEDVFQRLSLVIDNPSPTLPSNSGYPDTLEIFINACLIKNFLNRPNYKQLLQMDLFRNIDETKCSKALSEFVINHLE